jgi:uncharacterized protein (TIRG00374 family)
VKWLHRGALVAGLALFAFVVARVGVAQLWQEAARLGWGIVLIIVLEGAADLTHTCAWRLCFWPPYRISPLRLWGPNLAGNAINFVTPTATLGGDVVRGALLPREIPNTEAVASLTINRLTDTLSDLSVTLTGVVVVLMLAPLPRTAQIAVVAAATLLTAGIFGFLLVQRRGNLAGWLGRHAIIARLLGNERSLRVARGASAFDERLARFHAEQGAAVLGSIALHMVAVGFGVMQLFIFLYWIGAPADPRTVVIVFTVGKAVDMAAFFIPARLGAQEGGRVLGMQLVGVPGSLGLLFSLVLRLEQLVWTAIGLGLYAAIIASRRGGVKAVV